jgi:hypothetical protein
MPTINLSWTPAGGAATGQKVYRSNDTGITFTLLATISATANSYADTTPAAGDVYFYKVATVCASGDEEALPVDVCADASINTPIAFEGIIYENPVGAPAGFTQRHTNFSFSIGDLTGPQVHYQINKVSNLDTYTGGPVGTVTNNYNYCTGGFTFGQANAATIEEGELGYSYAPGSTWYTKIEIYFDNVLVDTIQGDVNQGSGLGKTHDPSNPTGFGAQYLFLEPKGGSGFGLVVSLVQEVGE